MPKPEPLPLDLDDLSDLPIFIVDWRDTLERQASRLESEKQAVDGYFIVIAAFQLLLVCRQFADHDPQGDVTRACDGFNQLHPHLRSLRNMLLHSDEYYRGQGNLKKSQGTRTFTYFVRKFGDDWHLGQGGLPEGQCNLSQLTRDGLELAARTLAAPGPGDAWLDQMSRGERYEVKDDSGNVVSDGGTPS